MSKDGNDLDGLINRLRWNPRGFWEIEDLTWENVCRSCKEEE